MTQKRDRIGVINLTKLMHSHCEVSSDVTWPETRCSAHARDQVPDLYSLRI